MRVVVGVYQVLDDIHPAHNVAVRTICPYFGLDETASPQSPLLAFTGKVVNIVALNRGSKIRVEEHFVLVGL